MAEKLHQRVDVDVGVGELGGNVCRSPCTSAPRVRSASMPARRNALNTRYCRVPREIRSPSTPTSRGAAGDQTANPAADTSQSGRNGMTGVVDDTRRGVAAIAPSTDTAAGKRQLVDHLQSELGCVVIGDSKGGRDDRVVMVMVLFHRVRDDFGGKPHSGPKVMVRQRFTPLFGLSLTRRCRPPSTRDWSG